MYVEGAPLHVICMVRIVHVCTRLIVHMDAYHNVYSRCPVPKLHITYIHTYTCILHVCNVQCMHTLHV
jgi:hypothetical protein